MILEIAVSLLAIACFGFVLHWSKVVEVAQTAMRSTLNGLSVMLDYELDDVAKEKAVRRAGFALVRASFDIFWRFGLALVAASAPIFLADWIGLASQDVIFGLMLRPDYIAIVSMGAIGLGALVKYLRPPARHDAANNPYSATDRFIHALAFASPAVLKAVSRVEDRLLFGVAQEPAAPPIFVTSLARGGTTALLNALHDIPGIATHTYRDMPFLTAPNLWNRLAGARKRQVKRQKRAHGDGLEIDLDSPEAFEEVLWKMFWPEKFDNEAIALWHSEDHKPEAERFFKQHMAKIVRARLNQRGAGTNATGCYCSKNNANIARIPYLLNVFRGCRIVIPFRRPDSHAASLLRQHQNFLKLQAEDEFVLRYMRDIGHFEFGKIHKPILFPGFVQGRYDVETGDYWLDYWIHAFREVLKYVDHCLLVSQDDIRSSPQATMQALCKALEVEPGPLEFRTYFRSAEDRSPTNLFSPQLYEEAHELYQTLLQASINKQMPDSKDK